MSQQHEKISLGFCKRHDRNMIPGRGNKKAYCSECKTEKLLDRIYEDGRRCRTKGVGITRGGKYDYDQMRRIVARWQARFAARLAEEVDEAWRNGWFDREGELADARLAMGIL